MADFKPFGSLRSVINGVKGRFRGTLSRFGSVAVLRREVDTMATKYRNLRFKFGGILVSEVGPVYGGGKAEYVQNVDEDYLSIPELTDYAKSFGISKLEKTYAVPSLGGDLAELRNDMDICNKVLFMHDGDTIDIYVCHDSILEDVDSAEGQISQSLSQVGESFNAHGKSDGSLTAQPKTSDLGLGSSSTFPSSERVENDGVADWTDTEEEVEPSVQQETEPSIQEESSTGKKRGRGQYERASINNTCTRKGACSSYKKRPRVVGQGVFVADTGYTCINSSAHVTCNIGFKLTKGLKWKGKHAMTQRELKVQSVMRRIQTKSKVVGIQTRAQAQEKSPSKKTS
ncbi:hypothetical protein KY284_020855 [Solanum tuberosum]|nr:hypothetical protein KY284_020855 [Solanum tuberosum]